MFTEYIKKHNEAIAQLNESLFVTRWEQARDMLLTTLQSGKQILVAGNGGSAADAQHFAAEFVGRFVLERRGYPAIALSTDTSALTSIGNDYGFEKVFSRQIEALGHPNDCFVGITTSGDSLNIITAILKARKMGLKTIVLTGKDGGIAKDLADVALVVPSRVTAHIQEAHVLIYHAWCKSVEDILHAHS